MRRLTSCVPLKVADVLELDRRVREYPGHPDASRQLNSQMITEEGPKRAMHLFLVSAMRDIRKFTNAQYCND